jgi:hypothetical protein
MGSAAHHLDFHFFGFAKGRADRAAGARKPHLLRRFVDAVIESDQRRSERAIAAVLARSGGRFTDAMEREAFERHFASTWWPQ